MTDPTTTPTPPQGLTDEQLNAVINQAYKDLRSLVQEQSGLLSLDRFITRAAIAADRANHFRDATKMALTPEEVEARFRSWWAESYPNAPAGGHAVRSHVAFALHLMGGEVGQ